MSNFDEVKRVNDYLICPKCGSQFVEYNPDIKRFKCLESDCEWIEKEVTKDRERKLELEGYNYLSGTFTSYGLFSK